MQYRHHLELTWLEDCLALKETLNFSKASASRYVTQPAFSRRIQSLEEWVGTPLFERSKRGVTLTKAGEVFTDQLPELIHSLYTLKSDTLEAAVKKETNLSSVGSPKLLYHHFHYDNLSFPLRYFLTQ